MKPARSGEQEEGIHIRAMCGADLEGVLTIAQASGEAPQWTRRDYEQILLPSPAALFQRSALVALAAGTPAGFAVFNLLTIESLCELEAIAVHPRFRRSGIGAALLGAAMASAARAGARRMRLELRESNEAALALYRRCGFRSMGRRKAYYTDPVEDALLLEGPLDCPS